MFTLEDVQKMIEEERVSCIQDIEYARLQGNSNEWKAACDAAIEAIRTRSERRELARARLKGALQLVKGRVA